MSRSVQRYLSGISQGVLTNFQAKKKTYKSFPTKKKTKKKIPIRINIWEQKKFRGLFYFHFNSKKIIFQLKGAVLLSYIYSTGNEIVDSLKNISFTGNIIPQNWYKTITSEKGKPDFGWSKSKPSTIPKTIINKWLHYFSICAEVAWIMAKSGKTSLHHRGVSK